MRLWSVYAYYYIKIQTTTTLACLVSLYYRDGVKKFKRGCCKTQSEKEAHVKLLKRTGHLGKGWVANDCCCNAARTCFVILFKEHDIATRFYYGNNICVLMCVGVSTVSEYV